METFSGEPNWKTWMHYLSFVLEALYLTSCLRESKNCPPLRSFFSPEGHLYSAHYDNTALSIKILPDMAFFFKYFDTDDCSIQI